MSPKPSEKLPWFARVALVDVRAVEQSLDRMRASGRFAEIPNAWQITLGVFRMWHRIIFRSETIGTSVRSIRKNWRAHFFAPRPLRFPFLVAERAIAPLDASGLLSSRERIIRHLLGAHHEGVQFSYDLQMLLAHEGAVEELHARAKAVVDGSDPRADYLRDLTVFEGYHEDLLEATERAIAGDLGLTERDLVDPDISFSGYLSWCARQPATYEETKALAREKHFTIAEGRA